MKRRTAPTTGPRFVRRRSPIHGYGLFARRSIPKGTRLLEYKGELIDAEQADGRYPEVDTPPHTFLFDAEDDMYIDGGVGGNWSRFINHSCNPNCEAVQDGRRIFIETIRSIRPGEELFYDYCITLDEPHNARAKKKWICKCGAPNCRGHMLGKKR